jgi:hypothetical protein
MLLAGENVSDNELTTIVDSKEKSRATHTYSSGIPCEIILLTWIRCKLRFHFMYPKGRADHPVVEGLSHQGSETLTYTRAY